MKLPQPCPKCQAPIMNYSCSCAACGYRPEPPADPWAKYISELEDQLSQALRERDELSADLLKLREATRVRPSQKAMKAVRETLEAMEAMDEEDAPALRLLVEMYDKLEAAT